MEPLPCCTLAVEQAAGDPVKKVKKVRRWACLYEGSEERQRILEGSLVVLAGQNSGPWQWVTEIGAHGFFSHAPFTATAGDANKLAGRA